MGQNSSLSKLELMESIIVATGHKVQGEVQRRLVVPEALPTPRKASFTHEVMAKPASPLPEPDPIPDAPNRHVFFDSTESDNSAPDPSSSPSCCPERETNTADKAGGTSMHISDEESENDGGSDLSEEELEEGNAEEAGEAGPRYNWRLDTVKGRMHAAGRDKRHSFDHKLFKGFLEKLGHISKAVCARVNEVRVKKSTANYCTYKACYLYYLDSSKVDLTKMLDKRDLQSYITLLMNYVTFATLKNIIAAFIRFVLYVRNNTEFGHTKQMNALDNALTEHLKIANRGVSNERNLKQLERRQGVGEVPLKECMMQLNTLLPKLKSIMKMD